MQRLFIICGISGTGKTTLAHDIAKRIGGMVITSERVISEMFPKNIRADADRDFSADELEKGYEAMMQHIAAALAEGKQVVADGVFRSHKQRERVRSIAAKLQIPSSLIYVTCPDAVAKERIASRFHAGKQQGGLHAQEFIRSVFEPPQSFDLHVDTSLPYEQQIGDFLKALT